MHQDEGGTGERESEDVARRGGGVAEEEAETLEVEESLHQSDTTTNRPG